MFKSVDDGTGTLNEEERGMKRTLLVDSVADITPLALVHRENTFCDTTGWIAVWVAVAFV